MLKLKNQNGIILAMVLDDRIGGRNYWIQSAFNADTYKVTRENAEGERAPGWYDSLKNRIVEDSAGNYCQIKPPTSWSCGQYFKFVNGEQFTISFEARAATDKMIGANIGVNTDLLNKRFYQIGFLTRNWKKFTLTLNSVGTGEERLHVRSLNGTADDEIHIRKIKLERGLIATDWTPAPEDFQSQLDELKAQIAALGG